jgi:hypothetical protein
MEGRQMLCGWGYSSLDLHLPVLALALESLGSWEKKMHKSGVSMYLQYIHIFGLCKETKKHRQSCT